MSMLPEIRQVLAFVAVVEEGSFTLAARRLHLTQSAVSHSLRSLEDQLSCRLINRRGKNHTLTPAGNLFFQRCLAVIAELEHATQELEDFQREAV